MKKKDRKDEIREQIEKLEKELDEITKSEYTEEERKKLKDVEIHIVSDEMFILCGGFSSSTPKAFMDDIVSIVIKKLGNPKYVEFVDIHLDNPWSRVILLVDKEIKFNDTLSDLIEKVNKK